MRFEEIYERCWTGYQQQGMKKKGDRQVPNCVPVAEVKTGPEMTLNDLLYTAAAKAMHQAGLEGVPMDYEEAIKKAAKIYRIPYTPSELPKLLAQRAEIDRKLAMLKQGKQVAKARRKEKLAPTPAGAEEYWRTHALPTDRIKPPAKTLEEYTGDPFIDNAARELLGFVLMFGVPFAVGTYVTLRNKLRKYQGREIIDALERKGVTMNRATYDKVKPVLDRFDQAIRDDDGAEAKALAKQIEQMIVMGKLSAPESRPADTALAAKEKELAEDLKKWFKEKWVRFGPDGKIRGDCARGSSKEGKPKCLPQSKAHALGKKGRASAAAKKRREDPNPERRGPAKNVATKVREVRDINAVRDLIKQSGATNAFQQADDKRKQAEALLDQLKDLQSKRQQLAMKRIKPTQEYYQELDRIVTAIGDLGYEAEGPTNGQYTLRAKFKEDANPKFAALIKNIQARLKKDDYQRPEIVKRVAQMVQQADPAVQDAMATARELVQQHGQGPAPEQTHIGGVKIDPIKFKPGETPQGINAYWQAKGQAPIYKVQEQNDWDDADEFGMPGSEFFPDDDRLRDGDYVRDRQDGEYGEIFRMSGDPSERRVRILDRDGKGWYISPDRLEPVDRNDPDIMKYFGKKRVRDMDEASVAKKPQPYNDPKWIDKLTPAERSRLAGPNYKKINKEKQKEKVDEKQDACYRKVKSRYKVWPSAYASGALVQCRKKGAANWGNKTKK